MAMLGMIGTGDWSANERPQSWREGFLYLSPNGDAPLTAIMSKLPDESVNDYHFHWFEKDFPIQAGDVTGVYKNTTLATVYSGDNYASGSVVYVKAASATVSEFRQGHTVALEVKNDKRYRTRGMVVARLLNGANSYIGIQLTENTNATYDIDNGTIDYIRVIGNINTQGGEMPQNVSYQGRELDNVTQIFRNPLRLTRTAARTRLRTVRARAEAKREAMFLHAIEMEKAFLWGQYYVGIGSNGEPETATRGIVTAIEEDSYAVNSQFHTETDAAYAGKTWLQAGEKWVNDKLVAMTRWGSQEKLALVGDLVWGSLAELATISSTFNLTQGQKVDYGIKVVTWMAPNGATVHFKQHPLMAIDESLRREAYFLDPSRLRFRWIDDTKFIEDPFIDENMPRGRNNNRDGVEEEFLTEAGLEYNWTRTMGILSGWGLDNVN